MVMGRKANRSGGEGGLNVLTLFPGNCDFKYLVRDAVERAMLMLWSRRF